MIEDVTSNAKNISNIGFQPPCTADFTSHRLLLSQGFTSYPNGFGTEKLEVSDTGFIIIGDERIDIRNLHDIQTLAQVNALAFMLRYIEKNTDTGNVLERLALTLRGLDSKMLGQKIDVSECIKNLYEKIEVDGLDIVDTGFFTTMDRFLDLPRPYELRAAINHMRHVTWEI